jgi:hypothetical protein
MMDIELKDAGETTEDGAYLLDIIENQLSVVVTISEMDGVLYDELTDDRIRTMSHAFKLIREAQRKLLEDVKKMGKG